MGGLLLPWNHTFTCICNTRSTCPCKSWDILRSLGQHRHIDASRHTFAWTRMPSGLSCHLDKSLLGTPDDQSGTWSPAAWRGASAVSGYFVRRYPVRVGAELCPGSQSLRWCWSFFFLTREPAVRASLPRGASQTLRSPSLSFAPIPCSHAWRPANGALSSREQISSVSVCNFGFDPAHYAYSGLALSPFSGRCLSPITVAAIDYLTRAIHATSAICICRPGSERCWSRRC